MSAAGEKPGRRPATAQGDARSQQSLVCPSAQPDWDGAEIFGVVGGTARQPRVSYLEARQPVTWDLLALVEPVRPTEVFRIAAPCAGHACQHFDGSRCQLVARTVDLLDEVTPRLPKCAVRTACRWWAEEGPPACLRCPQVVTESYPVSEAVRRAATPPDGGSSESDRDP